VRWSVLTLVCACGHSDTHFVDAATCEPTIVYLNKDGGTYTHGAIDDPAQNISVVVDTTRTLAPFPGDAQTWTTLANCIRDALAPFHVAVTDIDPGLQPHYELVFTDTYWAGAATTHVFPASCKPGHQIEFIFGTALATPTRGCEVAMAGLAEMAALLGPGANCVDFTSPGADCDVRSFVDEEMNCVDATTAQPAPCRCDMAKATQNPFQALNALFACR